MLSKTLAIHIAHEERHLWAEHKKHTEFTDPQQYIADLLNNLFKSGLTTKAWRDHCLASKAEKNSFTSTRLYQKIIRRTSRITRDFLKLRESLHQTQLQGGSEASLFFSALKNNRFSILKEGSATLHAEMRLASYIGRKGKKSANFGISKLCCACCNLSLCVVSSENISQISTRGHHGQYYAWVMPDFIRNNPVLLAKFLGHEAHLIYQNLTKKEQLAFITAIQQAEIPMSQSTKNRSMIADSSDSDIEFGLSCDSDSELEAVAFDQELHNVSILRELKQAYSEEYNNLLLVGVSPEKIFALFKESPEKLEAMADKNSISLISDYDSDHDVLEDLSELYDKSENDFWCFINDEDNAIGRFGYTPTLRCLEHEMLSSSDENEGDIDDTGPYSRATAKLLTHNTWQYEQDSEGEWVYPSSDDCDQTILHPISSENSDSEEEGYSSECSSHSGYSRSP